IITDFGAVEHNCAHADQRVLPDRTAMKNGIVAYGAPRTDRQRKAGIGVERAVVLDVGALSDFNPFVIAAEDCAEPDAHPDPYPHSSDNYRCFCDIKLIGRCRIGLLSTETEQRHTW